MRFVLVHGSWHTADCWDGVAGLLRDQGHEVVAPTLPGNGSGADVDVTMAETAAAVVSVIEDRDWTDVVLVGHSFGGVIVQLVTQQIEDRIGRAVFHNAYVVEDGRSVFDNVPPSAAEGFQSLIVDGAIIVPFELFHAGFMNDADEAAARAAFANLSPEPLARSTEPLELAAFFATKTPRSFVYATDDQVFPAEEFSWHPGMSGRLGPETRIVELPGSHEVLYSDPAALAAALVDAAA